MCIRDRLRDKGVVTEKVYEHEIVGLGVNGLKYLRRGFPEKQFLKKISRRPESLVIIKKDFEPDEFNYCVGFLKKNGYVNINKGLVEITEKGAEETGKYLRILKELLSQL